MGNKVRNFLVKNATILLGVFNFVFFIFGIVILATSAIKDEKMSEFFVDILDVNATVDFMTFCGATTIVAAFAGLIIVWKPEYRKLLVFYMALLLILGFMQIVIGGYMNGRSCSELSDSWFTTTAYYNRLRQDFKYDYKCCGFQTWNDDYQLDIDDQSYLIDVVDGRVPVGSTPGCYIDINKPNSEIPCMQKCDEVFYDLTGQLVEAVIGIGVIELVAGILVILMILREKNNSDPTTSAYYF